MYKYGLGQDWDAGPGGSAGDVYPGADQGAGGTADEPSTEVITGPVPDAPGAAILSRVKTPMALGVIGALAGFFFARSKKKRIRGALLGGAAGYGASFFVK